MQMHLPLTLSWLADPVWQWLAVCLGTFVLEDAATVEAALLVAGGHLSGRLALSALYVGVVLGDVGPYGLGRLGRQVPWARRWMPDTSRARLRDEAGGRVIPIVAISRFIPGARLPTYVMCGYLDLGLGRFALASALATAVWTTGLFYLSVALGPGIERVLGRLQWLVPFGLVAAIFLIGRWLGRARGAD
jgi:membrane protein DedA with SNARE-associated domain